MPPTPEPTSRSTPQPAARTTSARSGPIEPEPATPVTPHRVAENRRIRVGVVFGGMSSEHAISCVSAGSVLAAMDRDRFEPVAIGIAADGTWVLPPPSTVLAIEDGHLPSVPALGEPQHPTALLGEVDVVFPVLHGPFGEDGTIQGLLELAGIPYVGSGVFASAAAMDKHHMKQLLQAAGLRVPAFGVCRSGGPVPVGIRDLTLPVFVKPARGGSSIGISRVTDWADLDDAIAEAARHDPKVLVEQGVSGREIECGVLAGADRDLGRGRPVASAPAEIKVGGDRSFYDFHAKYLDAAGYEIPAGLSPEITLAVQDMAVAAFEALDCEGLARVDFFVTDDSEVVVNEVNTMPGFTPHSMFPLMWAESGVDYATLVSRLIDDALRRGTGLR